VDQFLLVRGDEPRVGGRTSELTVQTMLREGRAFDLTTARAGSAKLRLGAVAGLGDLPDWKREADFLFLQVGFSLEALVRWCERIEPRNAVYAGVIVLASSAMARNLAKTIPAIDIPDRLIEQVDHDPNAGVEAACELVLEIRETGLFQGVHLIPVSCYRLVAARLEQLIHGS
jgi:5,10-methylenetetrahydrofolate reductase